MSLKQPAWMNPAQNAADLLNLELQGSQTQGTDGEASPEATNQSPATQSSVISVEEARAESPVLQVTSERKSIRLLLITSDTSILQSGTLAYSRIVDLSTRFLEIHILVLDFNNGITAEPVIRILENVWGYTTKSKSWWHLGFDAFRIAETQLLFGDSFRIDVIIAEDLGMSGIVGLLLGRKYNRPFQLHIREDFFEDVFIKTQRYPMLYEWGVHYILDRVQSVRTKTEFQKKAVVSLYPRLASLTEVLPSYYNLAAWRDAVPTINLKERYPKFKFVILHISSMRAASHTQEVVQGAAKMLRRYPTLGLVILGTGPLRSQFERQVIAMGLQTQVEFEPMPSEVISYLKSANIFIQVSDDGSEDEYLLQAAVCKTPIIANKSGLAGKLFVHEESACLCDPTDIYAIAESINRYLNENQDRVRYSLSASETVFERVEQDYTAYLDAIVASIEGSITSQPAQA